MVKRKVSVTMVANGGRGPVTGRGTDFGSVETDALGNYKVSPIPPGTYTLFVNGNEVIPALVTVTVPPGKDVTGVDISVQVASSVSGTVMDRDKKPILSANVLLMQKLYRNGKVAYLDVTGTMGDLEGHYKLDRNVPPGGTYLVLTKAPLRANPAISDEPEELDKRLPSLMPAYYMNSSFPEGALSITPRPGQQVEGVDIQIERAKAYCVEGVTQSEGVPAAMYFDIYESNFISLQAPISLPGRFYVARFGGNRMTGSEGKFRICGLHPGEYRLLAMSESNSASSKLFAARSVSIADRDLTKVELNAMPGISLPGEVVWNEATPPNVADAHVNVSITPVQRGAGSASLSAPLPGEFVADGLRLDEYAVAVDPPAGIYVKDLTYGGISMLNQTFQMGSGIGEGGLKVVVAGDGGTISAKVADSDGNPVPSASVWFLPSSAKTAAELETVLGSCTTNAAGLCTSATLRPVKYLVFATMEHFTHSAAHIDRLWGARLKGTEVELGPKASAQVSLSPIPVF